MPRELRYTDEAIADLRQVRRWQTQPGSGPAAIRRVQHIRAAINRLRREPCLHPRGAFPGVREMICEGHCVIYRVHPDTGRNSTAGNVVILRIFGPGKSRERL